MSLQNTSRAQAPGLQDRLSQIETEPTRDKESQLQKIIIINKRKKKKKEKKEKIHDFHFLFYTCTHSHMRGMEGLLRQRLER